MSAPFIYVGTMSVKPGRVEALRNQLVELVDFVEANEPRVIAFHAYLDEVGNKLTIVHVHPDSASMEFHMQNNAKHFATAFDKPRGRDQRAVLRRDLRRAGRRAGQVGGPGHCRHSDAGPRGRVHPHKRPVAAHRRGAGR